MTMQSTGPSFSFVIPAFNEKQHIEAALQSVLAQSFKRFDVIVVDDGSTDGTPGMVEAFASSERVRLISHGQSRGSGAARNFGVEHASGDVVVFLDADVTVPADFLERLAAHYRDGADAVAVESRVADQSSAPARFQQAVHEITYPKTRRLGFSQAFSCRKGIAETLRFSEDLPGTAADDAAFAEQLLAGDYVLVREPELVVDHALPMTSRGLWRQAVKRGRAVVHFDRHVRCRSFQATALRRTAASARALIGIVLVVPALRRATLLAKHSRLGQSDAAPLWLHHHVYLIGYHWGQITELPRIRQMEHST
jgi:glycosyltransferase involved in cell wall biosynthesis